MSATDRIYRITWWFASLVIAAVLLSGYHKILYPADFAVMVYRFHLLPGALINFAALYLPWLEAVCAFCLLLVPRLRIPALWVVLALLILFTLALGINLWRGSVFGCGCFGRGSLEDPISILHLVRNAALIFLAAIALLCRNKMETATMPEADVAEPASGAGD
jgi:hypothetical protein